MTSGSFVCVQGSVASRCIALSAVALLFLVSLGFFWWDFTSPWGLIAREMLPGVAHARAALLLALASFGMLAAWAVAYAWCGTVPAAAVISLRYAPWVLCGAGMLLSVLALWTLRAFPNSGDEYDYLFQAKTFLHGRLWNPVLPGQDLLNTYWTLQKDGKWVTQYPPGWPLLLATARFLGMPFAAVNPTLGAVLLIVLFRFGREQAGEADATIALALVAVSAFFAFNAASYFDHIPAALFGLLFCYCGSRFLSQPSHGTAILSGVALGALGLIRPFDVLFFALPFATAGLIHGRAMHYRRVASILLSGLPFLIALLLYNKLITGNALLTPNFWGYPSLRLGWPSVNEHGGIIGGLEPVRIVETRLAMLAEWTSPLLVIGYGLAVLWLIWRQRLRWYDLVVPLTVAAYLLFPALGGNQYGPRYYFDSFPLAAVTVATALVGFVADRQRPRAVRFAAGLGVAHVTICCAGFILLAFQMRGVVDGRMDPYDLVRQDGVHNAVVILRSSAGVTQPMDPPDLTRNGLTRDRSVIYALDVPRRMSELRRLFPGRAFFAYERPPAAIHGKLIPLPDTVAR